MYRVVFSYECKNELRARCKPACLFLFRFSVEQALGVSQRHERKYNTSTGQYDSTPVPDAILTPVS